MDLWLKHWRITVEAYPPIAAAAHPAQLSACAMNPCTPRHAACCSQRVDFRISRSASCAIHAGSLGGAACRSRRVDFHNPRLIAIFRVPCIVEPAGTGKLAAFWPCPRGDRFPSFDHPVLRWYGVGKETQNPINGQSRVTLQSSEQVDRR